MMDREPLLSGGGKGAMYTVGPSARAAPEGARRAPEPRLARFIAATRAMLHKARARRGGINGWVCLALLSSVDEVHTRLQGTLDLVSLVCGLLLCCAVPLLAAPREGAFAQLPQGAWQKLGFLACVGLSIVLLFVSIIFSMLFLNGLNTSARPADKLSLLLHSSMIPTIIYTLFTVGCMALAAGLGCSMEPVYGAVPSACFSLTCIAACGVAPHFVNAARILPFSHVVHSYFKQHPEEFLEAVETALQRLEAEDEVDSTVAMLSRAGGFAAAGAGGGGADSAAIAAKEKQAAAGASGSVIKFRHLEITRAAALNVA
jgi:hypothetical protein